MQAKVQRPDLFCRMLAFASVVLLAGLALCSLGDEDPIGPSRVNVAAVRVSVSGGFALTASPDLIAFVDVVINPS